MTFLKREYGPRLEERLPREPSFVRTHVRDKSGTGQKRSRPSETFRS